MSDSLMVFSLVAFFFCFAAIVYCFLSSCLGLQIRRSDIWEAFTTGRRAAPTRAHQFRRFDDDDEGLGGQWDTYQPGGNEAIELMSHPPRQAF